MVVDGDDSFKRPGAVPFHWEIRPGLPKTRPDHDPSLLQPPKKLPPLRLKPTPPSNPISDSKIRPISPFAPPPSSYKLKPPPPDPDAYSHSPGPPAPYFKSSSPRGRLGLESGASFRRWRFPKSLFGMKKSKSGEDVKNMGQEESTSSESDNFYQSETTFSTSEESSRGSVSSTTWGSPKSSFSSSSRRGSPLKRNQSDLSSYEKKTISMMVRNHF